MASAESPSILLTFDVEDWFQVENFKPNIGFSSWNTFELRVEKSTIRVMDLLDSFAGSPKATFFILGWIAERIPGLIREIHSRGHEVASHGLAHDLCHALDPDTLLQDLSASKQMLEDIIGSPVYGYRAPSFSINNRVLELIRQAGYLYDSSYNSFSGHGRYGSVDLSDYKHLSGIFRQGDGFFEVPVSNLSVNKRVLPLGGGGYFRLLPFFLFRQGMQAVLKTGKAFVFYAHPWEFDPDQPRVKEASAWFKFRHYVNLNRTHKKLAALVRGFSQHRFEPIHRYLCQLPCN